MHAKRVHDCCGKQQAEAQHARYGTVLTQRTSVDMSVDKRPTLGTSCFRIHFFEVWCRQALLLYIATPPGCRAGQNSKISLPMGKNSKISLFFYLVIFFSKISLSHGKFQRFHFFELGFSGGSDFKDFTPHGKIFIFFFFYLGKFWGEILGFQRLHFPMGNSKILTFF